MNTMSKSLVALLFLGIMACSGGEESKTATQGSDLPFVPLNDPNLQLIYTPTPNPADEHKPIIDAINSAKVSVRLVMFILTDQEVVNALIAAHKKIPTVQVILDQSNLSDPTSSNSKAYQELLAAGVDVMKSSTKFTLTHEKSMVIDDKRAFITAMNMATASDAGKNRDFGVITEDASVIAEWNLVFAADVNNSVNKTNDTPTLSVPSLIWSPVSSESKLTALIGSAKSTIITTVETISDQGVVDALSAAVQRKVTVRLITPQCVKNPEPLLNYPTLNTLSANGVSVRLMPYPSSTTTPYMHSKMILVDNTVAYVGSVNFSTNSIHNNRETGIIFTNGTATQTISSLFESDWSKTIELPATPPTICPAVN
jgi:cardiolipin synthase A/B